MLYGATPFTFRGEPWPITKLEGLPFWADTCLLAAEGNDDIGIYWAAMTACR